MTSLVRFWLFISQAIGTIFLAAMVLIIVYGMNVAARVEGGDLARFNSTIWVMIVWAISFIICSVGSWLLVTKQEKIRLAAILTAVPVVLVPAAVYLMK